MSSYVPTDWVDDVTPVDAARMDNIEAGLVAAHDGLAALDTRLDAEEAQPDIPPVEDGKWLTGAGGALVWADAPVGGGGAIEYENAWAAGTAYQPGDVVIHEGVEYLAVNPSTGDEPAPAAAPSPAVIPLVTALPATPFDGQEVILVDVIGAATYAWRLRYVAARASNRWIFVGGSPGFAEVLAQETRSNSAYGALATAGPSFTLPVAGDYMVEIGAELSIVGGGGAGAAYMSYAIGGTGASDADAIWLVQTAGDVYYPGARSMRKAGLTAVALVAQYRTGTGVNGRWSNRWMCVTPLAVGGAA